MTAWQICLVFASGICFGGYQWQGALGASTRPYFYGEQLSANLAANTTDMTISLSWRFVWTSQNQPSNEMMYFLCFWGCPNGPSYLRFLAQSASCTTAGISYDGTPYVPWVGLNTELSYSLSSLPAASNSTYSNLNMFVMDRDWGLVTIYSTYARWSALISMTISPRITGGFNSTPRSTLTAIVVLFPRCGGTSFTIPTSDPDGDAVRCRWSTASTECDYCCQQNQIKFPGGYPFSLSTDCVLTYTGGLVSSVVSYSVCIQMEDYYISTYVSEWNNYQAALIAANGTNATVTAPQPLSSASLQFIVRISPNTTTPCVAVSPLTYDLCSLSCSTQSISSAVPQAVVPSFYSSSINSTVYLSCANGYTANPSNLYVMCVQTSSTSVQWVANGVCTATSSSSNITAASTSAPVGAAFGATSTITTSNLAAMVTTNAGALPSWAIGLIIAVAIVGALALAVIIAALVAGILWFLKRGCFAPTPKAEVHKLSDSGQSQNNRPDNNKAGRRYGRYGPSPYRPT